MIYIDNLCKQTRISDQQKGTILDLEVPAWAEDVAECLQNFLFNRNLAI